MNTQDTHIVTIGGGSGQPELLRYLKTYPFQLTAIVTMMDNGGSSGRLREDLGILPPGDLRKVIVALAEDSEGVAAEWNIRDDSGHALGNLALVNKMNELGGTLQEAVDYFVAEFGCKGAVVGVTEDVTDLIAECEDGSVLYGEEAIDVPSAYYKSVRIERLKLDPPVAMSARTHAALEAADYVVLTMGDLYTSVIPNLLVEGVPELLAKIGVPIIGVVNRTTKKGETDQFTTLDIYREYMRYLAPARLQYIVIDSSDTPVPEGDERITVTAVEDESVGVVAADLVDDKEPAYISGKKLAQVIDRICSSL